MPRLTPKQKRLLMGFHKEGGGPKTLLESEDLKTLYRLGLLWAVPKWTPKGAPKKAEYRLSQKGEKLLLSLEGELGL